ncbi:Gustatory receptor 22b [Halyomorpha halys]|nr:Gustatory receptor 22b [Halyomorpha halys]
MLGATKCSSKNLKDMFQCIFRTPRILGLFPFVFTDNDLVLSLHHIPNSVVNMITVSCVMIYMVFIQFNKVKYMSYAFAFVYFSPFIISVIIPNVSIFWLWINLKKFGKIFRALRVVEGVTQKQDLSANRVYHPTGSIIKQGLSSNFIQLFTVFSIFSALFIIEMILLPKSFIVLFYIYATMANVYLVMIQFTSILAIIRGYYLFLDKTLCKATAIEWTQCHEVLGACCEIVNRCYSPQLFIFTLSTFTFITSTIYVLISYYSFFEPCDRIISVLWICLLSLSLWGFIHYCHDTVQKAKNFDKSLYRLVLNDSSKLLLRNKRIMYHFQAKRKVEFSAMGFFNFDYSLICRMVSTATTYIVIMVQFSG